MQRILLYILPILNFVINVQLSYGQVSVYTETYTTSNGLAQNDINGMVKDHNGFLWLATNNGISRFDGYSFVNHKISTGQFNCSLNNQYEHIIVDADNNIVARNSMGQVVLYNQRSHETAIFPDPKKNRGENYIYVKSIYSTLKNGLWLIGADNGLINVTENHGTIKQYYYCCNSKIIGSQVRSVFQDADGVVWVLTNRGLGTIDTDKNAISNVYFYKENISFYDCVLFGNNIFFVCNKGVIIKYDKIKKRFSNYHSGGDADIKQVYNISSKFLELISSQEIIRFNPESSKCENRIRIDEISNTWKDCYNNLWIYNNQTLNKYNTSSQKLERTNLSLPSNYIKSLSDKSSFSIGYLNENNNDLFVSLADKKDLTHTDSKQLCMVLPDNSGVYWTNSAFGGLRKCVTPSSTFEFIKLSGISSCSVNAIVEDNHGCLWIATTDNKIRLFDENFRMLGFLNANGGIVKQDCKFGNASCLYQDREDNIWIGTSDVLYKLKASNNSYLQYSISKYRLEKNTPVGTYITDILEDKNGHIWITTDGDGLQLLKTGNDGFHFANRRSELKNSYPPTLLKTNCLYEDDKGNIWLGSSEGLALFPSDFPELRFLKFFYYNPENSNMSTSVITGLYQDKGGKMWLSSYGGGLLKISNSFDLGDSPEFITYNTENKKLGTDLVLSIEEDCNGNIWAATEKSIIKIKDRAEDKEAICFTNEIGHNSFGRQIFLKTRNNSFVLGAASGFYVITASNLKKDEFKPSLVLTRFQLFNKDVNISSEDSPLIADINSATEITLGHKQNVFSIEFAALDYRNSSDIEYAYKLDNFEDDWNYVGSQRIATYTNLPPGDYVFRVKSTNSSGNWCDNDKVITIHVLPSFWQTGWAWFLYILIFSLVLGGVIYAYLAFYKMQSKMKFEQELSTMKMQFFTDISHELRTPLTLINAPLENVLENGKIGIEDKKQLEVVHTNAQRMLRMLTQILDFRKLQSNKMRLHIENTNMYELISKCCNNFSKMAESRHIDFVIENKLSNLYYWVDRDKIDTVMFNLVSNAFKFTPEGKKITVELSTTSDNSCSIKVSDEGCGMPKDKLGIIFDRFSTLQPKSLTNQSGTGIGLALVKEIIDLHKGHIDVISDEGNGSTFIVTLKPGTDHYDGLTADIIINDKNLPQEEKTEFIEDNPDGKLKLLVIEDNDELRHFIVSVLSKSFNTIEAANGEEGLKKTKKEMPDLVLSDIMMPLMDGIEYVKQIRMNEQTSHIPIVLLTAKTDLQSKIECMKIGANDYITKPFSMAYLQARIENILTERKSLQERYRIELQLSVQSTSNHVTISNSETGNQSTEIIDKRDDLFMKKMIDYIHAHMDDSNLSPDELANGLKVSRWNLTCKVKSLVGQTPIEFIKDVRLNKAAQLIQQGELSMTQISYMIGMSDSRYFSRCFKQKFGMTPTEYKNNKNDKPVTE